MVLAEGLEPSSRPDLGLTAYKAVALPIMLRQHELERPSGFKPPSPRLEGAHIIHYATGAWSR